MYILSHLYVYLESLRFASEGDDPDNLLTRALLVGNFKAAVDICISIDRMVSLHIHIYKWCQVLKYYAAGPAFDFGSLNAIITIKDFAC